LSLLSSLVLAFAPAIAARWRERDELAELKAELAGLKIDLADARRERDEALSDLAFERRASARASRLAALESPVQQASAWAVQQARAWAAQQANAAAQQQMAMVMQQQGYAPGPLGSFEGVCNCVPARHDLFLRA